MAKVLLQNNIEVGDFRDIIARFSNNIVVGIPSGYNFSPCEVSQAYLYCVEDSLLLRKSRIRKLGLCILSYLFSETQLFKILKKISSYSLAYMLSFRKLNYICREGRYKKHDCGIEELRKITRYRVKNII